MNNAIYNFSTPENEKVLGYLAGSPERIELEEELHEQSSKEIEIPLIIGGREVRTGDKGKVVMPHNHGHVLATYHKAGGEFNLVRWTSPRTIKETFVPVIDYKYPYMKE